MVHSIRSCKDTQNIRVGEQATAKIEQKILTTYKL